MCPTLWVSVSEINTPVVPIRLDFGLSLKDIPNARDNQFYITIGNPF